MQYGNYRYYDGKQWYFGGTTVLAARQGHARFSVVPDECRQPWRALQDAPTN